uniref:Endoplasmic reticulum membrane sensor NFE2L1 n=1 Tax=Astyanax mexicanus TaxID=7994 RepID=A0A3B1IW94_ASTMX
MQSLKKYFTEGLIQVAILLSLAGIRVDVDPYLPPLAEIIQGQSSALTQTQFHNLQNSLDGYSHHLKSVDLDGFFTTRRLLRWVRSLDHLQVPAAQLETWLVHREPENSVTVIPGQTGALDGADGLVNMEESAGLTMRMGSGVMTDLGYGSVGDENMEDVSQLLRNQMDNEDIKEDADEIPMWQQELNHNIHQQQLPEDLNQQHSLFNEEDQDELMMNGWRNTNPFRNQLGSILGEDVQFAGYRENNSLSIEECLQLLEADPSLGDQQHLGDANMEREEEDPLQHHRSLLSPLLPQHEPLLDLEQQWQDVLDLMDPQDMDVDASLDDFDSNANIQGSQETREREHMGNSTHQDLSLHQTHQSDQNHNVSNSSNTDFHFNDSDIINFLLSPPPEGSVHNNHSLPSSPLEEQNLPSLFDPLLEDAMFEEISLLDLALEEGFNSSQVPQSEEQEQTDSDSGLSLDFSQSPASPSGSESSCSSSSSSCSSSSMSSTDSTLEEGAVGYVQIKEEPTDEEEEEEEEEGAVGGYNSEQNKMFPDSYMQASQFHNLPWLQQIDHDHTYNQPQCTIQRKSPKQRSDELLEDKIQEKFTSRDEKRALSLKIPFSTDCIINLPVEEFNELLGKYHLSEAQLTLIRDIRRRGKNKMAAQNCRRRKLDVLVGLERSVDGLRRHRARLLREKSEVMRSVQEMKQRLNDLYQEVYGLLREEQGMLCSANDFLLEQENSSQGPLSTRYSSESRRKSGSKRYKKD